MVVLYSCKQSFSFRNSKLSESEYEYAAIAAKPADAALASSSARVTISYVKSVGRVVLPFALPVVLGTLRFQIFLVDVFLIAVALMRHGVLRENGLALEVSYSEFRSHSSWP